MYPMCNLQTSCHKTNDSIVSVTAVLSCKRTYLACCEVNSPVGTGGLSEQIYYDNCTWLTCFSSHTVAYSEASVCKWGPSYWCQSRTTARQCGQEKYCRDNVWKVCMHFVKTVCRSTECIHVCSVLLPSSSSRPGFPESQVVL